MQVQTETHRVQRRPLIYTVGTQCRTTAPLLSHDDPNVGALCEVLRMQPMSGWKDACVPEYRVELVHRRGIRDIRTHKQLEFIRP